MVLRTLLDEGAEVNAKSKRGRTPLMATRRLWKEDMNGDESQNESK